MHLEYNLSEITSAAEKFLKEVKFKTILFQGDLGAGKTTLIKELVKLLGSKEPVSSPTFSIINQYKTEKDETIYHLDLYRLKDEIEAYDMGIDELLDSDSWKFIEWPEKINNLLGDEYHMAIIKSSKEFRRSISFS